MLLCLIWLISLIMSNTLNQWEGYNWVNWQWIEWGLWRQTDHEDKMKQQKWIVNYFWKVCFSMKLFMLFLQRWFVSKMGLRDYLCILICWKTRLGHMHTGPGNCADSTMKLLFDRDNLQKWLKLFLVTNID